MKSAAPYSMKRTHPRRASSATRAAFALLPLVAILLAPTVAHAAAPQGAIDSYVINAMGVSAAIDQANNNENGAFEKLLESYTLDTTSKLQEKSAEFHELQSQFDSKLVSIQKVRDSIKYELGGLQHRLGTKDQNAASSSAPALDQMYDDMDVIGSKVVELMRRTEGVLTRVGEYNRLALKGHSGDAQSKEDDGDSVMIEAIGLETRLENVLKEELQRRDRYNATMIQAGTSTASDEDDTTSATESDITATHDNDANVPIDTSSDSSSTTPSPYITLTQLDQLLSPKSVIVPSETTLKNSLSNLANQLVQQRLSINDAMWNTRLSQIPNRYEKEFTALQQKMKKGQATNTCLAIPQATEMVGRALQEHYHDGTDLVDVAKYETGGSVVYELTSASYVPPPRTTNAQSTAGGSGNKRAVYEYEKQNMFDDQTEEMYHQQQAMLHQDAMGKISLSNQFLEMMEKLNGWEWYTSFQFDNLRQYLPQDWERVLDGMSDRIGEGRSWSEYTPRGAMDALVPDYVYHSLGMSNDANFGKVFGRTASPEVAISAGYDKSGSAVAGGAGGWTSKPMGHCYPLSMRSEDDPALSLLSRMEGDLEYEVDTSILAGPKYTVRLPHAVHIDAVTLEHRSFPLSKGSLEHGGWRGGESAPRWVRVVGFPPCSNEVEVDEADECGVRGFDITQPIDLGSFEYQRITVTGREDDYGGSDDDDDEEGNDAFAGGRRRSIQTFAVKGGTWKPSSLLGDEDISIPVEAYDSADPRQCSEDSSCGAPPLEEEPEPEESLPAAGQCAPPKDEDSEPSCGGDDTTSVSSSGSSNAQRQVVEAVSFIIEENWGNSEYTCLYRVRVHGDA
eukprot:CAMPEP_0172305624 /NCGR_PEP_ID=MMETSP1058-20130122/6875_1 /TAXON_ID=83371 /ORGANISM="Detonula confervacea, Strain CCMP 353" /LENGTH=846 /DNA_ID=CAMNT_0013017279 /DNA_START=7 /DNA_END=2543 /DNA_ORIENTATION=+